MGGSIGGGNTRGDVKGKNTYIGDNAGRQAGILDQILGIYAGGQQQANAQNDLLFGGKGYGSAGQYFGPGGAGGQGGGGAFSAQNLAQSAQGAEDQSGDGSGGGGGWPGPGGTYQGSGVGNDTPFFDPNSSGNATPSGGLVGQYQGMQSNPWQTAPGGDAESDVLGSYDWMSSGVPTGAEKGVYGGYGNLGDIFGAGGTQNGQGGTVEGDVAGFQGGQMQGGMNANEQDVANRLKGASSGYGQMAGGPNAQENALYGTTGKMAAGPNAQESALYGDTGAYGSTRGKDVGTASDTYRGMVEHGGYDDATKAAMTREAMSATRSPFEQARDRVLRGAAARGNVGSTQGTEIQLANQEAGALGDTASKNQIAQAQEAIRQKEAGAQGLVGTQGVTNAAKQFGLGQQAAQNAQLAGQKLSATGQQAQQNAQLAGQKLAGLGGQASTAGQLQAGTQAQRGYQQAGAQGLSNLAQQAQAARTAGLAGQAGQNQALRTQQLQGAQGKEGMFNTMAQRGQVGTQGLQNLYNTSQQQRAGDLAAIGNVGGKTAENYVESGSQTGSI